MSNMMNLTINNDSSIKMSKPVVTFPQFISIGGHHVHAEFDFSDIPQEDTAIVLQALQMRAVRMLKPVDFSLPEKTSPSPIQPKPWWHFW